MMTMDTSNKAYTAYILALGIVALAVSWNTSPQRLIDENNRKAHDKQIERMEINHNNYGL